MVLCVDCVEVAINFLRIECRNYDEFTTLVRLLLLSKLHMA